MYGRKSDRPTIFFFCFETFKKLVLIYNRFFLQMILLIFFRITDLFFEIVIDFSNLTREANDYFFFVVIECGIGCDSNTFALKVLLI